MPSPVGHKTRQILIVGDLMLSYGLMRTVLTRLNYSVTCVAGAVEGLQALAERQVDLALVALRLGDRTGVDLVSEIRRLRGIHRNLPIIVFGDAWDHEAVRRDCRRVGAQAYLEKPISISRLLTAIRGLLTLAPSHGGLHRLGDIMSSPIDLARLIDMSDGDLQFEREMVALYLTTAPRYVEELRQHLNDPRAWGRIAHSLKGASRNIGAVAVADLAEKAEHALPDPALLAQIAAALEESRGCLTRRHPDAPGAAASQGVPA